MTKILVDSELLEKLLEVVGRSDLPLATRIDLGVEIRAALDAPQQEAVANCTCGSQTFGDKVVHRQDGPCYYLHPAPSVLEQEARKQLGELLAVIHGDGGHYAEEHGIVKATADAIAKWHHRPALSADARKDAELLDWLEQKRQISIARGFQWDAFTYDALQSKKTIREQINAAMAAQKGENE